METLPALDPAQLTGLEYIGVDEVARAKGHRVKKRMKGTHYLLLENADKLSEKQSNKLQTLLDSNSNPKALYVLKEQLQSLWSATSFEGMAEQLESGGA